MPRAGIVHRLDKDTSGLLVVAKTLHGADGSRAPAAGAHASGASTWRSRVGDLARGGTVDAPIGRHPTRRTTMAVVATGKPARTHYDVARALRRRDAARAAAWRPAARTRSACISHRSAIRWSAIRRTAARQPVAFPRQALHARRLGLVHPLNDVACEWESPLPRRLRRPPAAPAARGVRERRRAAGDGGAVTGMREWPAAVARSRAAGLDWIAARLAGAAGDRRVRDHAPRGASASAPRDSLNLAAHRRRRSRRAVARNRRAVGAFLPTSPVWLEQVHGRSVVRLDARNVAAPRGAASGRRCRGDARARRRLRRAHRRLPAGALRRSAGGAVGAAHAGWRGLAAGVLEATVAALAGLGVPAARLVAWLGPAIGPQAFEVGDDVVAAFCDGDPAAGDALRAAGPTASGTPTSIGSPAAASPPPASSPSPAAATARSPSTRASSPIGASATPAGMAAFVWRTIRDTGV